MLALVAASFALVLAGVASHQLSFSTVQSSRESARNQAESVVSLAIARVLADVQYGKPGKPGFSEVLEWNPRPEERGRLVFDPQKAAELGLPVSTNNLERDGPVPGWKRDVPCNIAQLVGTGQCRGEVWQVEVLLHTPQFPFCIAASGKVESDGPLLVGQLNEEAPADLSPERLLPGHLASHGSDANAVLLSAGSLVTGNVEAVGGVVLTGGAQVRGKVKAHSQPTKIPELDIPSYCPDPGRSQFLPNLLSGETVKGNCIREGSLTVTSGLTLDKSVLYVKGDLTVDGGLSGYGAVIVEGKTTIRGGASMESDNKVALVSRGDVSLTGAGQTNLFRGLVYSTGNVEFSDVTVVGSFVANKPVAEGGSSVELHNSRLIHRPEPFTLWPDQQVYVIDAVKGEWLAKSRYSQSGGEQLEIFGKAPGILSGSQAKDWRPPAGTTTLTLKLSASPGPVVGQPRFFVEWEHSRLGKVPPLQIMPGNFGYAMTAAPTAWMNNGMMGADLYPRDLLLFINHFNAFPDFQQLQDRAANYTPTTPKPITIDLNQFLSPPDRIKVLMWRDFQAN